MKKIDWMRKLTSRKLWLSVASFVTLMVVACGGTENEAAQISALIMAGATVIGYVIGEGMTDARQLKRNRQSRKDKVIRLSPGAGLSVSNRRYTED